MIELNKIYNEDCLKTMKKLPDKCCDVFTDPPYNVGKDYGVWNDTLPDKEYKCWIEKVLNELKRISNILVIYVPKKWNLFYWNILGEDFQEIILPFSARGAIRYGFSNQFNKLLTNARPKLKSPILNVWYNMPQPGLGFFFRENTFGHPGYTSLAITVRAIRELTTSKLIYDPFMGTGTTAIAAIKCDRNYLGSELNIEYIKIANKRIKAELSQSNLFKPARKAGALGEQAALFEDSK